MILAAHDLEAFVELSQTLSFSEAARRVHITQPALSQRIQSLERALGLTLFTRDRREVRLTDAGSRLLRYCQAKRHLEDELLSELGGAPEGALGGRLRVAGYSTVMSSIVLPALATLLRANPAVQFELLSRELRDIPGMLARGEADFIVLDHALKRAGVEESLLGHEENVLIESRRYKTKDVYLDHDPHDRTTEAFLKKQSRGAKAPRRCYLDDIHGIIAGVSLGLGRAVVPRHLVPRAAAVRVVSGLETLRIPIVLHHFKQPYYSRLQREAISALKANPLTRSSQGPASGPRASRA